MIKHIVMWRLHEEANRNSKRENAEEFKSRLEALIPKIDAIKSMEVGIGYNDAVGQVFDMVLTTTHDSKEELEEYVVHPDHQEVLVFGRTIVAERKAVDYEVN